MSPLSFAALAASGPLWEKDVKPGERRCKSCCKSKKLEAFTGTATTCQQCNAANKLRRSREKKKEQQAKLRKELHLKVRNANRQTAEA